MIGVGELYTYLEGVRQVTLFKTIHGRMDRSAMPEIQVLAPGDILEVTCKRKEHQGIHYIAVRIIGGAHGHIMELHFEEPYMVHIG
jgi:hypothetical protein